MEGGLWKLLFAALTLVLIVKQAAATKHEVGGSQGWDESTDFSSWASTQTFKVGDQLVFKYTSLHSVVELGSERAYKSCDIGSAVNSMNGGNSVVKLTKPGTRYFACGTMGHCDQGMKVKITTVSPSESSSSPASSSSTATTATSAPSTSGASGSSSFTTSSFMIVAGLLLALFTAF